MKKGISMPMIAIVFGLVFIVIVLIAGFAFQENTKKLFEEGPFKPVKPDTTYTTGISSGKGAGTTECNHVLTLSGSANDQASQIAAIALTCYDEVEKWWTSYKACEPCVKPTVDISRDTLFEAIINKNHKWSTRVVEMITADWEYGYEKEQEKDGRKRSLLLAKDTPHLICADADLWPNPDDMFLTGKMTCKGID